jgi:hypothetical protein
MDLYINDRMPPIYTQCSKIKTALGVCFDKIWSLISVKYNEKSYLHNWLAINSILFNVQEKWNPMRLNFAVLTATILPGFIIAQ